MELTHKDFVRAMVENPTIFAGNTRNILTADEVYVALINSVREIIGGSRIVETRECKAHSDYIEFSGGSRLDIKRSKCGAYKFPEFTVYYNGAVSKGDTEPWTVCWYIVL